MMAKLWIVLVGLCVIISQIQALRVGVGIADVTGPAAEVTFMGYAKADQKGAGLHLRQFARAFILDEDANRVVYVTVDVGMMGIGVKQEVLKNLKKKYGNTYTEANVILSGTHTHSAPGGFLRYLLFDIPVFGFVKETYNALIDGITLAIVKAHKNVVQAKMYFTRGQLLNANINRSPTAYLANPKEERDKYEYDVDKDMVQIRFISDDSSQKPLGAIHWFAVHPTSMNNTNRLISSDNVGYASLLFEISMNNGTLPGKGSFVGAFASTNLGDVSPNIRGPRCMNTGRECEMSSSACEGRKEQCVASGPGKDMFESTKIIGERLFNKGKELWSSKAREVTGPIRVIHQYVHMPSQRVPYKNPITQKEEIVRGCPAAMGYSFAAGTTDGPGAFGFEQGTTTDNPLWNMVRDFLSKPSKEQIACHGAKPILLNTGEMSFPYQWQPNIVAIQLAFWGSDLAVAAVPGEFTTMSGRRLRNTIRDAINEAGGPKNTDVVIAGLSNIYTDYITTPEEYNVQRYEAASTVYGPHTLTIYQYRYAALAKALVQNKTLEPGKTPPEVKNVLSLVPPVLFDVPGWRREFGDCVLQPPSHVRPGDTVIAKFVAGHPRNNNMHGKTFLTVERLVGPDQWDIVATDANWETKFKWNRRATLGASSEATVEWELGPDVPPGEYRIRHFGYYKYILGGTYPYEGISKSFQVI